MPLIFVSLSSSPALAIQTDQDNFNNREKHKLIELSIDKIQDNKSISQQHNFQRTSSNQVDGPSYYILAKGVGGDDPGVPPSPPWPF